MSKEALSTESAEGLLRRIAAYRFTRFRRARSKKWVYVKQITKREYDRA